MEISLGRWNTKLFLGRKSYLLSQKKGHTKGSKTIRKIFLPQTRAAQTRRESSLRVFSQDVQFDSFGFKKTWENLKPHPLNQKDPRDRDYSDTWKLSYNVSIKPTLSRPAGNRACGFFSQDVQFELFGAQKVQKEHLEKRFGGSIFSRRPIWAFWRPKSPKRASWEKVWWLDFLKTSNLSFLAAKKSKKSVLRKGLVARFLAGPGKDSLAHR